MSAINYLLPGPGGKMPLSDDNQILWNILFSWIISRRLGEVVNAQEAGEISRSWIDEWQLGKIIGEMLREIGEDDAGVESAVRLVRLLCSHQEFSGEVQPEASEPSYANWLRNWLQDVEFQRYLKFNRYQGILWFNREAFDDWLWWNLATATIDFTSGIPSTIDTETRRRIAARNDIVRHLHEAADNSYYQVELLVEKAKGNK